MLKNILESIYQVMLHVSAIARVEFSFNKVTSKVL